MLEESVSVTRVDGQTVWVEGLSAASCSGCTQACSSTLLRQYLGRRRAPLAVHCALPVQPGDQLVIGVDERAMLCGSLLVYVLPLCGLLAGAALVELLVARLEQVADWPVLLGGVFGFAITLLMVKKLPGLGAAALQPVVLRKIH